MNYFYDTLAPYGGWVNFQGYGWCWRPTIVVYNTGWQPYCDNGHWVYTDCGWYWVSGYSWGWATFHYGRWFHNQRYGWCWRPDTTWSPSWVLGVMIKITVAGPRCRLLRFIKLASDLFTRATPRVPVGA